MLTYTRAQTISFCLALFLVFTFTEIAPAATKKSVAEDGATMNEAELQSQVMAFADRFIPLILSGTAPYKSQVPPPEEYKRVYNLAVYSFSSAFTIAAQVRPVGALLDMPQCCIKTCENYCYYLKIYMKRVNFPCVQEFTKREFQEKQKFSHVFTLAGKPEESRSGVAKGLQ